VVGVRCKASISATINLLPYMRTAAGISRCLRRAVCIDMLAARSRGIARTENRRARRERRLNISITTCH